MSTGLLAKLALTTVATVGLYVPTMGLPLPLNFCLRTLGVANAAPSPTCASDLRECLRQSADLRQTTFGGRYVTADDVARCMEAFNACISGGASRGGNQVPPSSSTAASGSNNILPTRFQIKTNADYRLTDCRVDGNSVTCEQVFSPPVPDAEWNSTITGTLSGLTMTGTQKGTLRSSGSSGCTSYGQHSGPVTYAFDPNGNVAIRMGPLESSFTFSGCLTNTPSQSTEPLLETTGTWSPVG